MRGCQVAGAIEFVRLCVMARGFNASGDASRSRLSTQGKVPQGGFGGRSSGRCQRVRFSADEKDSITSGGASEEAAASRCEKTSL